MSIGKKQYLLFHLCLALMLGIIVPFNSAEAQESALEATATYTGDLFSNIKGGADTGIRYMDNLDLELELGLGWNGTQIYLYGLANQGGSVSELTGDVQGVSNIESETSWRLYEAWIQTYVDGLRLSILAGLYDLNSEFDAIGPAGLFINSSHGIGAEYASSGVTGPSIFPYTSASLRLKLNPVRGVVIKAAVLDGVPSDPGDTDGTKVFFRNGDGLLFSGEIVFFADAGEPGRMYLGRDIEGDYPFRLALGGWSYSKERTGWDGDQIKDNGIYLLTEYNIFSEPENPGQGLSGFLRYGIANEEINGLRSYAGAGLVYTGLFEGRPGDQAGLAFAIPFISGPLKEAREDLAMNPASYEMNIETTYLMELSSMASLQFDLQYIIHPGMLEEAKNALAIGARIQLAL